MRDRLRKHAKQALRRHQASRGDDLTGFMEDINHFLWETEQFKNIEICKTGDPHCAIVATCQFDKAADAKEMGRTLETIWVEELRYGHHETDDEWHEITTDAERITLAFVTARGLCVTGEIIAEREEV